MSKSKFIESSTIESRGSVIHSKTRYPEVRRIAYKKVGDTEPFKQNHEQVQSTTRGDNEGKIKPHIHKIPISKMEVSELRRSEPSFDSRIYGVNPKNPSKQGNYDHSIKNPFPAPHNHSPNKLEVKKPLNPIYEMKKQILRELMEINKIPASYFLLGKDCVRCKMDIDVESVAELVEISSNQDGDIVIRPIEKTNFTKHDLEEKAKICEESVKIKKMEIGRKPIDIVTRKNNNRRLLPIKRTHSIKHAGIAQSALNNENSESKVNPLTITRVQNNKMSINSSITKNLLPH